MRVVLIPGYMNDEALWQRFVPLIQPLFPDLTHADLRADATIEAIAARTLKAAPERFIAVGFSMGGYVAREMVRLAPERVAALILIATSARGDTPEQTRHKLASVKAMENAPFKGLSRSVIATSLHPQHEELIEPIREMSERMGREVFIRQSLLRRDGDSLRLAEIPCPTLIVASREDRLRSLAEAEELQVGIAGAELVIVDGAGHMLPLEAPQQLAKIIQSWLQKLI